MNQAMGAILSQFGAFELVSDDLALAIALANGRGLQRSPRLGIRKIQAPDAGRHHHAAGHLRQLDPVGH